MCTLGWSFVYTGKCNAAADQSAEKDFVYMWITEMLKIYAEFFYGLYANQINGKYLVTI